MTKNTAKETVETVEFNGTKIPVDALFVSPVDRVIYETDGMFAEARFEANVPRQLRPSLIPVALAQGIQRA